MKTARKNIIFVYADKEAKDHIEDICSRYNDTQSNVVNKIIMGHKYNRRPLFVQKFPKYILKALKWKTKKEAGKPVEEYEKEQPDASEE